MAGFLLPETTVIGDYSMPLKLQLDSLEGLDDGVKSLYVEKDGQYVLDVDGGAVPKSKLDEFRQTNVEALKERDQLRGQLSQYKDVNLDEYREWKKRVENDETAKLLSEGKAEEWFAKRTEKLTSQWERKLTEAEKRAEEAEKAAQEGTTRYHRLRISNEAARLVTGLEDNSLEDVQMYAERWFSVSEDDEIVPNDNAPVWRDGKPLQISDLRGYLLETKPNWFKSSQGGGARGANKSLGKNAPAAHGTARIRRGLEQMM